MDQKAIEIMTEGGSKIEVCATIGISKPQFYEWLNPDSTNYKESFHEAVLLGEVHAQAWWERQGKAGLWSSKDCSLNTGVWIYNMKCRFPKDWIEQKDVVASEDTEPVGFHISQDQQG